MTLFVFTFPAHDHTTCKLHHVASSCCLPVLITLTPVKRKQQRNTIPSQHLNVTCMNYAGLIGAIWGYKSALMCVHCFSSDVCDMRWQVNVETDGSSDKTIICWPGSASVCSQYTWFITRPPDLIITGQHGQHSPGGGTNITSQALTSSLQLMRDKDP